MGKLDVGDDAGHDDQIDRPLADRLIGDVHVAALGVAGDGKLEIAHGGRCFLLSHHNANEGQDEIRDDLPF